MTNRGSLSVQSLRAFVGLAAAHGIDPGPILGAAGIRAEVLADIDGRLELEVAEVVAHHVMERLTERQILLVFRQVKPGDFGMLDHVIHNCRTLGESFERLARYQHVHNGAADCSLESEVDGARLRFALPADVNPAFLRLCRAAWTASCIVIARRLVGEDFAPTEVRLPDPAPTEDDLVEYRALTRSPVALGGTALGIGVSHADLERVVIDADPALAELLEPQLERSLRELSSDPSVSGAARRALAATLSGQEPALESVAKRLGTTPRTLQRRLREEGTSFHDLLDSVRQELAAFHVRKHTASLDEIAWRLGFSSSAAFHRAFKRWTGQTPGEFRRH